MSEAAVKEGPKRKVPDFPPIEEVVHPRAILPGVEWAFVKADSVGSFVADGWELCSPPVARILELEGQTWLIMKRGEAIKSSMGFIPKVSYEE